MPDPTPDCVMCDGTGWSIQGWTDKNGEPEDQYGSCRCTYPTGDHDQAAARRSPDGAARVRAELAKKGTT